MPNLQHRGERRLNLPQRHRSQDLGEEHRHHIARRPRRAVRAVRRPARHQPAAEPERQPKEGEDRPRHDPEAAARQHAAADRGGLRGLQRGGVAVRRQGLAPALLHCPDSAEGLLSHRPGKCIRG